MNLENCRNFYLDEFTLFDGEYDVKFNIIDINLDKMIINLAITKAGKIIVTDFDLHKDKNNKLYFQYGVDFTKINIDDFEKIED